jgi:nitrous oxidase accessory protein NosD
MTASHPRARRAIVAAASAVVAASLPFVGGIAAHAATTITVPGMQPTIQAGINAASAGDTVLVSPGTYRENVDFKGKAITVVSSQGATTTVIDGGGVGPVANFSNGESRSSVLQGFTLQHGTTPGSSAYEGGGVHISGASPSILGNVITGNGGCSGMGISVAFASPLIQGNTISNNLQNSCSGGQGGGIYVRGAGSAQILHNTITGNRADSGGGIALFAAGSPAVEDNNVSGNSAGSGGGLYAVNQSDAIVVQNIFAGNTASTGAGLYISPPSGTQGPTLTNNTIAGNNGTGLWVGGFDDRMVIENTLLVAPTGYAALLCDTTYEQTPPTFVTDDIYNGSNTAVQGPCLSRTASTGDLAVDPHFVSPANADYHLANGSPAIDAGTNPAPDLPATDLDGNPRIVNGIVDLGVYEHVAPATAPGAVTSLQALRSGSSITVSWSPPLSDGGSPITAYRVTIAPGGTTSTVGGSTGSVTYFNTKRNAAYTFTVVAVNTIGAGPQSSVTVPKG